MQYRNIKSPDQVVTAKSKFDAITKIDKLGWKLPENFLKEDEELTYRHKLVLTKRVRF